jgi:hypothetical protein
MNRPLWTVLLVLTLTGCTSAKTPGVPTAAPESNYDKALRYTRCMNDNGVKVPDPVVGKPLPIAVAEPGQEWLRVPPAFDKCRRFMPATWPVKMDPADIAREKPFADCMRKRGIDMPEPDVDGMVSYPADPAALETPEYNAAVDACRYLYDDPANKVQQ